VENPLGESRRDLHLCILSQTSRKDGPPSRDIPPVNLIHFVHIRRCHCTIIVSVVVCVRVPEVPVTVMV
jgi:hypothetical protein